MPYLTELNSFRTCWREGKTASKNFQIGVYVIIPSTQDAQRHTNRKSLQRHFTVNSKRPRLTSLNHHVTKSRLTVTFRSTIPVRCCGSKTHETFLSVSYLLGRKLPSCPASLPSEEITYVGLCISSNLHFSWAGGVVLAGTRQKMHEPGLKCPLKFPSLQPFINVGFAGYDVLKQVQLQTYSV